MRARRVRRARGLPRDVPRLISCVTWPHSCFRNLPRGSRYGARDARSDMAARMTPMRTRVPHPRGKRLWLQMDNQLGICTCKPGQNTGAGATVHARIRSTKLPGENSAAKVSSRCGGRPFLVMTFGVIRPLLSGRARVAWILDSPITRP